MNIIVQLILCLHLLVPTLASAQAVAHPLKDPLSYTIGQYGFIFAMSLLGGIVGWYAKVKNGELQPANLMVLVGELTTSALAGLISFYVCEWLETPPILTPAIVGLMGHMGPKGLTWAEDWLQELAKRKAGLP